MIGIFADRLKFLLSLSMFFAVQLHFGWQVRSLDVSWVELPWEQSNKWSPELFKALSFGHLPAAIDWLWMRSLQDPSYSHVPQGVHPPAFYDLDLATDLDPAYFEAYADGIHHLVVIRDDEEGALQLLEKAEKFRKDELPKYNPEFQQKFWGNSWSIPMLLAYTYLFEFEDLPKAAMAFKEAARIPGSPSYLDQLADRLSRALGEYEVGLRVIDFMIASREERLSSAGDQELPEEERLLEELKEKRTNLLLASFLRQAELEFGNFLAKAAKLKTRTGVKAEKGSGASFSEKQMQDYWTSFLRQSGLSGRDPLGGTLSVGAGGKVSTTTPYRPVFGLQ